MSEKAFVQLAIAAIGVMGVLLLCRTSRAGEAVESGEGSTRYGPFSLLDQRSDYGKDTFIEPFLNDDSDGEDEELQLDYIHLEKAGQRFNNASAELEKGVGPVTFELSTAYDYNSQTSIDPNSGRTDHQIEQGFENIDLGVRTPVYQFVSSSGFFDTTFGCSLEIGIPPNTRFGKNAEIVPAVFNDTVLGNRLLIETIVGYSMLLGGGDDGGVHTLEYGVDFGYIIPHDKLPIPLVDTVIPIFELSGESILNHEEAGEDDLYGVAGGRVALNSVGEFQPSVGVGYIFPIDQGARDETRWGLIVSFIFEY